MINKISNSMPTFQARTIAVGATNKMLEETTIKPASKEIEKIGSDKDLVVLNYKSNWYPYDGEPMTAETGLEVNFYKNFSDNKNLMLPIAEFDLHNAVTMNSRVLRKGTYESLAKLTTQAVENLKTLIN